MMDDDEMILKESDGASTSLGVRKPADEVSKVPAYNICSTCFSTLDETHILTR